MRKYLFSKSRVNVDKTYLYLFSILMEKIMTFYIRSDLATISNQKLRFSILAQFSQIFRLLSLLPFSTPSSHLGNFKIQTWQPLQ